MIAKLFQWDEFLTPTLVRIFFMLSLALVLIGGLVGIFSSLAMMRFGFFQGLMSLVFTGIGVVVGVIFARMAAEMVLIVFKINDNLKEIRERGGEGM